MQVHCHWHDAAKILNAPQNASSEKWNFINMSSNSTLDECVCVCLLICFFYSKVCVMRIDSLIHSSLSNDETKSQQQKERTELNFSINNNAFPSKIFSF